MVGNECDDVRLVVDDENALGRARLGHGLKLAEPSSLRQLAVCHEYVTAP
jgi:hypothetical protein